MNWLQVIGSWLARLRFWVVVAPWELAVRVRCGRRVRTLPPGFRLRIPVVDRVYVQCSRVRTENLPLQTIGGHTVSGVVEWSVGDLEKALSLSHSPRQWVINAALAAICQGVYEAEGGGLHGLNRVQRARGLLIVRLDMTDVTQCRAYRLLAPDETVDRAWGPWEPHA